MGWAENKAVCTSACAVHTHLLWISNTTALRSIKPGMCSINVFGLIMKEGVKLLQTIDLWRNGLMTPRAKIIPLPLNNAEHCAWRMPRTPRHCALQTMSNSSFLSWTSLEMWKALQTCLVLRCLLCTPSEHLLDFRVVFQGCFSKLPWNSPKVYLLFSPENVRYQI